jgi:hypothetical protein
MFSSIDWIEDEDQKLVFWFGVFVETSLSAILLESIDLIPLSLLHRVACNFCM